MASSTLSLPRGGVPIAETKVEPKGGDSSKNVSWHTRPNPNTVLGRILNRLADDKEEYTVVRLMDEFCMKRDLVMINLRHLQSQGYATFGAVYRLGHESSSEDLSNMRGLKGVIVGELKENGPQTAGMLSRATGVGAELLRKKLKELAGDNVVERLGMCALKKGTELVRSWAHPAETHDYKKQILISLLGPTKKTLQVMANTTGTQSDRFYRALRRLVGGGLVRAIESKSGWSTFYFITPSGVMQIESWLVDVGVNRQGPAAEQNAELAHMKEAIQNAILPTATMILRSSKLKARSIAQNDISKAMRSMGIWELLELAGMMAKLEPFKERDKNHDETVEETQAINAGIVLTTAWGFSESAVEKWTGQSLHRITRTRREFLTHGMAIFRDLKQGVDPGLSNYKREHVPPDHEMKNPNSVEEERRPVAVSASPGLVLRK